MDTIYIDFDCTLIIVWVLIQDDPTLPDDSNEVTKSELLLLLLLLLTIYN